MRKKIALLSLVLLLILTGCAACNNRDKGGETVSISLSAESLALGRYETARITATVTGTDEKPSWSSSDENIVTVDDGFVVPTGEGNATVTASVEGASATCTITVTADGQVPSLVCAVSELALAEGATYRLSVDTTYKGQSVAGGGLTFESNKTDVATVDSDGKITAVSRGEATVTVGGTYLGYDMTPVEIAVSVTEDVTFVLDTQSVEIALNGALGDATEFGAADLGITLEVGGSAVSAADVVLTSAAPTVAKVESGKVIAVSEGKTTVTVSYTTPKGTEVSATVNVTVFIPVGEVAQRIGFLLEESKFTLSGALKTAVGSDNITRIDKLTSSDAVQIYDESESDGDTVALLASELTVGESTFVVYTDGNIGYKVKAVAADVILSDVDDFEAYFTANPQNKGVGIDSSDYILLGADVDLQGSFISNDDRKEPIRPVNEFTGTFDGNGHVMYNFDTSWGLFGQFKGTVKNLAIVGATSKHASVGGVLGNEARDNFRIENVYAEAVVQSGGSGGGLLRGWLGGSGSAKNVVVKTVFTGANGNTDKGVIAGQSEGVYGGTLTNCYGIASVDKFVAGQIIALDETNVYSSVSAMQDANLTLTGFDPLYWDISSGYPIFKSRLALLEQSDIYPGASAVSTVPDSEAEIISEYPDGLYKLEITSRDAGVLAELDGNKIVVDAQSEGGNFTVRITSLLNSSVCEDITFTVKTAIDLTSRDRVLVDLTAKTFRIGDSLTASGGIDGTVTAVALLGGSNLGATHSGNTVTLGATTGLAAGAEYELMISVGAQDYKVKAFAATNVLYNKEDFAACFSTQGTSSAYILLGDNIDMDGADIIYDYAIKPFSSFTGTLDGNGYTLSNYGTNWGLFGSFYGTVKNIALINATSKHTGVGGILANESRESFRLENIYAEATVQSGGTGGGLLRGWFGGHGSAENVVVKTVFTGSNGNNNKAVIAGESESVFGGTLTNCYGIASVDKFVAGRTTALDATNIYPSIGAMQIENLDLSAFSSKYWDVSSGYPIFISYRKMLEATTPTVEASVTQAAQGDEITVTTNMDGFCDITVIEAQVGVKASVQDGKVKVAADSGKGTFKIKATNKYSPEKSATVTVTVLVVENLTNSNNAAVTKVGGAVVLPAEMLKSTTPSAVTSITKDDVELLTSAAGASALTIDTSALDVGGEYTFVIATASKDYMVKATVADVVFNTASEITKFFSDNSDSKTTESAPMTSYILFGANIDMNNATITRIEYFDGVFDGNGYTMSNFTVGVGLFHYLNVSQVGDVPVRKAVKNIGFVNATSNHASIGGIVAGESKYGTLDNVYAKGTVTTGATKGGLIGSVTGHPKFTNIMVNITFSGTPDNAKHGAIMSTGGGGVVDAKFENCFAVTSVTKFAANKTLTIDSTNIYASEQAMKDAHRDLSAFDSKYWDVKSGVPVWKTAA